MAISALYVPLFTIEEVILDKDSGLPLTGGIVKFYKDSQRQTPKPVFQITGTYPNYTFVSVGAVLTLGIAGDFVDGNGNPFVPYAFPYDDLGNVDLYFVTVESSGNVAQFTREAVPYIGSTLIPPSQRVNTDNELSNPQFVEVNFASDQTLTLNVTGTNTVTKIAPDWDIITSGTGVLQISRLQPTAANIPTNPPYALSINASGSLGSFVTLRQRLSNSPSIMRQGYASASITAAVLSGGAASISMSYQADGQSDVIIIPNTPVTADGAYHIIAGNNAIPDFSNVVADTGYVDIKITIPTSRTLALTSIQVVGTGDSVNIPFDEMTAARQKDQLFHYYEDAVVRQAKGNLLAGWTFGLNPYQFINSTQTTVANKTQYIADQTILHQETASALKSGKGNESINFGLNILSINGINANRFALIQYIDYNSVKEYFGQILSSLARAAIATTHGTQTKLKMRLIYRTLGDPIPTVGDVEPITGWDANGDVEFAAGWTAIIPQNDPAYTLSARSGQNFPAMSFDKMQLPTAPSATPYLGIVVYITAPLNNTLGTEDSVTFDRISLLPNDFGQDALVETFDESLRRCQFYYETSYPLGNIQGDVTVNGQQSLTVPLSTDAGHINNELYRRSFQVNFKTIKRSLPVVDFWSPSSSSNGFIQAQILNGNGTVGVTTNANSSSWTQTGKSQSGLTMIPNDNTVIHTGYPYGAAEQGVFNYHYAANCLLGL